MAETGGVSNGEPADSVVADSLNLEIEEVLQVSLFLNYQKCKLSHVASLYFSSAVRC